jgi:hypothetical protein
MANTVSNKQAALVDDIKQAVLPPIMESLKSLAEKLVSLSLELAIIQARLESTGPPTAVPKRTIRTASSSKKPATAKSSKATNSNDKITNALLFFRHGVATNINDMQTTYATTDSLSEADKDPTVVKKNKETDPAGYYSAVGAFIWKTILSEDQKEEVRNQFNSWKEQTARADADPQLEADSD